jgi:hypothetical protein
VTGRAVTKQIFKFVPFIGWAANAAIGFGAIKLLVIHTLMTATMFVKDFWSRESFRLLTFGSEARRQAVLAGALRPLSVGGL